MAPKEAPPPGVRALNMNNKQMEKYALKTGPGRRDVVAYQTFNKDEMLEEVAKMGFYSAWNDVKKEVEAYPDAELLVVADLDEKYGENWWIALTPAAKDAYFEVFRAAERAAAAEREAAEAEERKRKEEEEALERVVVHDTPRVPRPYTSASAAETETSVRYMSVARSRPLVTVRIQRRLALFGGRTGLHDRTGEALAVDIRPRKDPGYDGVRKENSVCLQAGGSAVASRITGSAQTTRHVPAAFSCQANLDDPDDSAFAVLAHAINLDAPMETLVEGGPRVPILRTDPEEEEEPPASDRDLAALVAATLATASALESGGADPSHRSGGVGGKPGARSGKGAKGVRGPLQRLQDFLKGALPMTEQALSQNETLNIYANELASMAEEGQGSTLGSSGGEGSTLREERQFMDLALTANNALPAVEWHPRHPSWLAVASAPLLSWEARLADAAVPRTSHILLFTTAEFTAQAVLDAPADVTCLAWHPTDPGWLAAGLVTGGVLVFDLGGAAALARAGGGKEGEGKSLKHITPKSVTAVESSHSGAVVALRWLPTTHHISHRGQLAEDKELGASGHSAQLMSVGSEGGVYVWDTRFREKDKEKPKAGGVSTRRKSVVEGGVSFLVSPLVPGAAAAGVLTPPPEHPWAPVFRTAFKLNGRNAGIATVSFPWSPSAPSALPTDPLLLSTMDGRMVAMDWTPGSEGTGASAWLAMTAAQAGAAPAAASKGGDDDDGPSSGGGGGGGGSGGNRVLFLSSEGTDSPSPLVARCPTMPDVVLVLRDFAWALLKAGEPRPLLVSPPTTSSYTTGAWSPTRPGVVFLGRVDGALETWDIGDSTTHPASVMPLVSSPLTCLQFRGATGPPVAGAGPGAKQSIAVGDAKGSLHVLDVPPPLRRGPATEEALLRALLSRESTRVGYVARRGVEREGERARKESAAVAAAAKREAAAAVLESELAAARGALVEDQPALAATFDETALIAQKAAAARARANEAYLALQASVLLDFKMSLDSLAPMHEAAVSPRAGTAGGLDATVVVEAAPPPSATVPKPVAAQATAAAKKGVPLAATKTLASSKRAAPRGKAGVAEEKKRG